MSIYAASDLHGNLPAVPEDATLVLLAGDICPDFRPSGGRHWEMVDREGYKQGYWLDTVFRHWLMALIERGVIVVAIWGNHDFVGEHPQHVPDLPWHLLQDSGVELFDTSGHERLRIYGTPWVPGLPYWAFFGREEALQHRADAIPEGLDILMSHGPPFWAGDFIPTSDKQRKKYGNYGGQHVGDRTLTDAIRRAKPKVTICGHIHEARGKHSVSTLPVLNVAAVDALYNPHLQPWTKIHLP